GVPTSYYTSVQFVCKPVIIDDPQAKADILSAQMADMEPEGGYGEMAVDSGPYGRMLPLIRGLRLQVIRVEAKFKYDDHKSIEHREHVSEFLEERHEHLDAKSAMNTWMLALPSNSVVGLPKLVSGARAQHLSKIRT
ncbi:MAG: hypothetical protein RLZZ90_1008, partial [Actinomycetota bacterium]